MATKVFCDACGKEGASNKYFYRYHLQKDKRNHACGFVDAIGNHISGRDVSVDLCNKCYNEVITPSVLKLEEIQSKNFLPNIDRTNHD